MYFIVMLRPLVSSDDVFAYKSAKHITYAVNITHAVNITLPKANTTKKSTSFEVLFLFRRRPIFPGSFPPSIFGTVELNYRVRDGNGWDLNVIDTESVKGYCPRTGDIITQENTVVKHFF